MKYNELTRRYFEHPDAVGVLSGPEGFRGAAGSRAQGTWVQFDVRVSGSPGARTVEAARFLAFGCPHVIAASAWIAECAVGREAERRLPESAHSLRERFAAPVEKLGRLLIVEDAWIAAMRAALSGSGH
jgi:NifU-like protein involved in Fe-S cluster formation